MRLITFKRNDALYPGIALEDGVVDLAARMKARSVRELIAENQLQAAEEHCAALDYGLDEVQLQLQFLPYHLGSSRFWHTRFRGCPLLQS